MPPPRPILEISGEEFDPEYPWRIVPLQCEHDKFGASLVDCAGVPRFYRVRCKATRHKEEGKVTFHVFSLRTGAQFGPFRYPYRPPRELLDGHEKE